MIHQTHKKIRGFASLHESITKSGFFSFDWENSEKFTSREVPTSRGVPKMQEPEQP